MPLVKYNCQTCPDGTLEFNESQNIWECIYCGSKYTKEELKIIYNHNTTVNNNIHADNIIIKESDFNIVCGELMEYKGESTDVVVPENVIKINERAFSGTMLTSLVLPEKVRECYISNCKLLSKVTISGSSADSINFCDCPDLNSIEFLAPASKVYHNPDASIKYFSTFKCNNLIINNCGIENINLPFDVKNFNLQRNSKLKSVNISTFSSETVSIGDYAFKDCTALESISIGKCVKSIGNHAFENCTSLKAISDAYKVESIGNYAFSNCTSLKYVNISNVNSIGDYAFFNCTSLETIKRKNTLSYLPEIIGIDAFKNCNNLVNIGTETGISTLELYIEHFPAIKKRQEKGLCIFCGHNKFKNYILFSLCKKCYHVKESNRIISNFH